MSVSPDTHTVCLNKNHVAPTVDSEREEFRKYLENEAVLNVLTKVLKDLYEKENKPTDPLNFMITKLGALSFEGREIIALKEEIKDLRALIADQKKEIDILKEQLDKSTDDN